MFSSSLVINWFPNDGDSFSFWGASVGVCVVIEMSHPLLCSIGCCDYYLALTLRVYLLPSIRYRSQESIPVDSKLSFSTTTT